MSVSQHRLRIPAIPALVHRGMPTIKSLRITWCEVTTEVEVDNNAMNFKYVL